MQGVSAPFHGHLHDHDLDYTQAAVPGLVLLQDVSAPLQGDLICMTMLLTILTELCLIWCFLQAAMQDESAPFQGHLRGHALDYTHAVVSGLMCFCEQQCNM